MRYITILGELNNDRIYTRKKIYYLNNNTNVHAIGFGVLKKDVFNCYNLLKWRSLEITSTSPNFHFDYEKLIGN